MRERKNGVIEWTMRHYQITLLVITVLVGLGILGLVDMPKQEFPEFTIRQGVVVGVYPGATSGEVEEQLAKPLERYLFTFKEVKKKKTYSMSRDGMVYVMVELNDDVNNKDEVWSKIKLGLQNFKSQLPSGVLAVIANDDFGDTSALLITLESEDKTYRELQRYMETLEDRLRRIESVSNLRRYGVQNEQISVYLDPDKLAAYGLDTRMLMTTLFTQGFTTASGSLENGGEDCSDQLEKSDQKCSLISKLVHTVDLRRFVLVIILNNDKGDTEDNQSNRNARVIVKPFLKQIIERHSDHDRRDTCNKDFQPEDNDIHLHIT